MLHRGQLQARHDPFHYLPRFLRLEAKVAKRSGGKLRDFVRAMSGGATPKAEEHDKYYADSKTGVPFVRVQNLSVSGQLQLDDVKYINEETHNGMLARSQVQADDLLVKITGVGRMAVASVPPTGFEGNINQHIARIRTDSRHSSEVLAAWLNTDVAETLAKRRSTGGTRPALDFGALRSMPVIFDEQVHSLMQAAYEQYQLALSHASAKLAGVDDYLFDALGIVISTDVDRTISNRIFRVQRRSVAGWRFDARVHRKVFQFSSGRFPSLPLRSLVEINPRSHFAEIQDTTVLTFVPMEAISDVDGVIAWPQERMFKENIGYTSFQEGDLLWAKITPCMENGKSAVAHNLLNGCGFGSTEYHVLRPRDERISVKFLHALLRTSAVRLAAEGYFGGSSGHQRVDEAFFYRLNIPLPDVDTQARMVEHIELMRNDAKRLRQQAQTDLASAKAEIESVLFGDLK
jgi:hypothetical protein